MYRRENIVNNIVIYKNVESLACTAETIIIYYCKSTILQLKINTMAAINRHYKK